jgi:hypothetical protein
MSYFGPLENWKSKFVRILNLQRNSHKKGDNPFAGLSPLIIKDSYHLYGIGGKAPSGAYQSPGSTLGVVTPSATVTVTNE